MGRQIKEVYIGAFIKVKADRKTFVNYTHGEYFYEKYENDFIWPYEGLEFDNILLPSNPKCRVDNDVARGEPGELNEFELAFDETFSENVMVAKFNCGFIYRDSINELKEKFGDVNVIVCTGIIQYIDECA
jgi:hypothetical protein